MTEAEGGGWRSLGGVFPAYCIGGESIAPEIASPCGAGFLQVYNSEQPAPFHLPSAAVSGQRVTAVSEDQSIARYHSLTQRAL